MKNSKLNTEGLELKEFCFIQRLIGVIISPVDIMKFLINKPKIVFGILSSFFTPVLFYLSRYQIFRGYVKYTTEISSGSGASLTENELTKAVTDKFIFTPFASLVWLLIISGLIYGIIKLFKGSGNFKQIFSITGYSNVIVIVSYVVNIAASFFTGNFVLNTSLTRISNLFAPDLAGSYIYGFLRGVDVFGIWYFAVISIGIVSVSKLSKAKVITLMAVVYIICIMLGAGSLRFN